MTLDARKLNQPKYRTVEEIMKEFGCEGKHSDREYLQDVIVRIDCLWRQQQEKRSNAQSLDVPPEHPFTSEELKTLQGSPFKAPRGKREGEIVYNAFALSGNLIALGGNLWNEKLAAAFRRRDPEDDDLKIAASTFFNEILPEMQNFMEQKLEAKKCVHEMVREFSGTCKAHGVVECRTCAETEKRG